MNAWLRQIHTSNALYVPGPVCDEMGLADGDWVWLISGHGRIKVEIARHEAVNRTRCGPGTPSASARAPGASTRMCPRRKKRFLMNHLINELLPPKGDGLRWSNSDPITGQAAWYDLRVRIEKAEPALASEPRFSAIKPVPGTDRADRRTALRAGVGDMTMLPATAPAKKLGLVIDLDVCVGCHACVVSCKEWNTGGHGAALSDQDPYGADVSGTFLNRVHTFEVVPDGGEIVGEAGQARIVHFPKSCLHCDDAPCVTVCPTGASYKRDRGRHRAGRRGHVHRLRPVRLGLPLWRARDGPGGRRHEEVHAVRRPHLQRDHRRRWTASRPACAPARSMRAIIGDLGDPSSDVSRLVAERGGYRPDAGAGHAAGQQVSAAAPAHARLRASASAMPLAENTDGARGFFAWLDGVLDRI